MVTLFCQSMPEKLRKSHPHFADNLRKLRLKQESIFLWEKITTCFYFKQGSCRSLNSLKSAGILNVISRALENPGKWKFSFKIDQTPWNLWIFAVFFLRSVKQHRKLFQEVPKGKWYQKTHDSRMRCECYFRAPWKSLFWSLNSPRKLLEIE